MAHRFQSRTIVLFLVAAVVPAVALGLTADLVAGNAIKERTLQQLDSISGLQEDRISAALDQDRDRIRLIASRTQLRISLADYLDTGNTSSLDLIGRILEDADAAEPVISGIHIIAPDGSLVSSSDPTALDRPERPVLDGQDAGRAVRGEDFWLDGSTLRLSVADQLLLDGRDLGHVQMDLAAERVTAIVQQYDGLGRTGETVLARRDAGGALVLTGTRFDADAALALLVPSEQSQAPLVRGLEGQVGVYESLTDYRGTTVLASVRYLEESDLAVVTKIDVAEALAPQVELRWKLVGLTAGVAVIGAGAGALASAATTRPVRLLGRMAERMTAGEPVEPVRFATAEFTRLRDQLTGMHEALLAANRHLEQRVEERTLQLRQANDRLQEFAFIAAHDLSSPLRTIRKLLEAIDRRLGDTLEPRTRHMMDLVRSDAHQMQRLVSGLLDFSRYTRLEKVGPVDVTATAQKVVEVLQQDLEAAGATVEVDDIPSVQGDANMVRSALLNLVNNAIRYRSEDRALQIRIAGKATEEGVEVLVTDNGIGIAPDYQDEVFTMFRRLEPKRHKEGIGVGLAVVRRVMDLHEGRVEVESAEGEGSTFRLLFLGQTPLVKATVSTAEL